MSRWAVRKLHPHACIPDGTAWVAGEVGKWQNTVRSFRTYEEAMAYADQRARTIEVTLPRVAPHPDYGYLVDPDDPWVYSWDGRWHLAPIGDWDGYAALLCNDRGEYKIWSDELRPLALALLALARRKEKA
ncbi:hypothetical protein [Corynebacterium sp. HMSC062E11]|uniref:hypothetical protein n=1 Tax=Corynebacterium sp. HMSC062E11 TaxID=1739326 RepID=UPI00130186C2|nr:hypothetical protein [Corynebacterium sp. HMSC062E11]